MKTATPKTNTNPKSKTDTQAIPSTTPALSTTLPDGYIADGTLLDADGNLRPEYIIDYPRQLADLLKPMDSMIFCAAFLVDKREIREDYNPYRRCVKEMALEAIMLVHHRKAPAVLVPMILAAIDTVRDTVSFDALYHHLGAIFDNMLDNEEPDDPLWFLDDGLLDDGILRPEYVGRYAKKTADLLRPLPASTFYSAFLEKASAARKPKTSYICKRNLALDMVVQARKLVYCEENPAPDILIPLMEIATATVHDAATFDALYRYLDAVYSFLLRDGRSDRL